MIDRLIDWLIDRSIYRVESCPDLPHPHYLRRCELDPLGRVLWPDMVARLTAEVESPASREAKR